MAPLNAPQLRDLADALDDLGKIRHTTGVKPGAYYERERISLGDETWILVWVEDEEHARGGYYTAELNHA